MKVLEVVAGFHVREDDWILPGKLHALSAFCSRIVVLLDRCGPSTEMICAQFPKVEFYHHQNTLGLADEGPDGPICEEGLMRQWVWDKLAEGNPDWIVLGDADEIPTPDVVRFFSHSVPSLAMAKVDLFYLHTVNLYKTPGQHIAGPRCVWSYQYPGSNKKAPFVRFRPERQRDGLYRYDTVRVRHCRIEPSPAGVHAVITPYRPLIDMPKLIHWKWVNWSRWEGSFQAELPKYVNYWQGMELRKTPKEWLWQH